jgi:hypothetical protein
VRDVFATSSLYTERFSTTIRNEKLHEISLVRQPTALWIVVVWIRATSTQCQLFQNYLKHAQFFNLFEVYSFFLSHTPRRPFRPENKWAILLCQKPSSKINLYYYSTVALRYFKFYILATLWRQSSEIQRRLNTTYYFSKTRLGVRSEECFVVRYKTRADSRVF